MLTSCLRYIPDVLSRFGFSSWMPEVSAFHSLISGAPLRRSSVFSADRQVHFTGNMIWPVSFAITGPGRRRRQFVQKGGDAPLPHAARGDDVLVAGQLGFLALNQDGIGRHNSQLDARADR